MQVSISKAFCKESEILLLKVVLEPCKVHMKVLVAQSCCPPGSSVLGILQARVLEWVAVSFSRVSSQPRD